MHIPGQMKCCPSLQGICRHDVKIGNTSANAKPCQDISLAMRTHTINTPLAPSQRRTHITSRLLIRKDSTRHPNSEWVLRACVASQVHINVMMGSRDVMRYSHRGRYHTNTVCQSVQHAPPGATQHTHISCRPCMLVGRLKACRSLMT